MRYSLLLDEDGGILDDLMITNSKARRNLYRRQRRGEVGRYGPFARWNLPDEITLNYLDDHGLLALQGPKAVDALARLVPEWPLSALTVHAGGAASTWKWPRDRDQPFGLYRRGRVRDFDPR